MIKKNISIKILISLVSIFALALVLYIALMSSSRSDKLSKGDIEALREIYIRYDDNLPIADVAYDKIKMAKIIDESDLVIVGEVVENMEDYKAKLTDTVNNPEDMISGKLSQEGINNGQYSFSQTKVKALDCWKGQSNNSELIIIQNKAFTDYEPQLKPGEKIVLHLLKGQGPHESKYWFSKYGLYFVTDNDYVLSAVSNDDFEQFTGCKLETLKEAVKSKIKD